MSSVNWYRVDFTFTTLPLLEWIEVSIQDANNLLGFILTTGFGEEYNFLNSCCKDPFIVPCMSLEGRNDSPKDLEVQGFDLILEPREGLHVVSH